jgi:hypothetical protein
MGRDLGLDNGEIAFGIELLEQGLPPLTRPQWLPFLLGVSPKLVGAMTVRSRRYYRRFRLPKKAGGYREIVTPRRFLKTIQRWLLCHVLPALPRTEHVHGFVEGRGIFSNARRHLEGRNLLALDVQDFFPSVKQSSVETLLSEHLPFPGPVARQLAGLTTLAGALPQGAPTSPALANAAFHGADLQLGDLAEEWKCIYTRYADDIAFSGDRPFTGNDISQVESIVSAAGFALHREKSRIVGPGSRQVVAGVVVNEAGLPPRASRRRWRAMFHRANRFPREFADRASQLAGVASFVNQYSPRLANEYFAVVGRVREAGR